MLGEDTQTLSFRGRRSRNKVSVGEPAEGSLSFLHPHTVYCSVFYGLGLVVFLILERFGSVRVPHPASADLWSVVRVLRPSNRWSIRRITKYTTLVDGYLGMNNDEERSEMRYVVRIAEFSESSRL